MFYRGFEGERLKYVATSARYHSFLDRFASAASKTPPQSLKAEGEIEKYYAFNETGNIMISSTLPSEDKMRDEVRDVFQKISVFFAAMTKALTSKGKNLYDYDAINAIIGGSGVFSAMHDEERTFQSSSTSVQLNTDIIKGVLGAVTGAGAALAVAQKIIGTLGAQIRVSVEKNEMDKKIAHVLFVCENLLGMPLVNVSLFYISCKEAQFAVKTNCAEVAKSTISFKYRQQDFMFVDPEYIARFSDAFKTTPAYDHLVEELAAKIP